MKRIQMLGVMVVGILLGCTSIARASAVMFTDLSAWQAQVLGAGYSVTSIDFEDAIMSPGGNTVTAGDVIFLSPYFPLEITEYYGIPYNSGKVLYPSHNQLIQIELPDSVYAFGFDLGELGGLTYLPAPTLNNVVLSTGDVFAGPFAGNPFPTYAFFGFYSDIPIVSLSMNPHALIEPILDNFTYAQDAIPSPEPSTLLLIGSGLFGIMTWRKRRGECQQ